MPKLKTPLQQTNHHKVGASQWRKWPDIAQRVFNATYEELLANQHLLLHPKADPSRDEYWKTTAWNAAWIAADNVVVALKDIEAGVGYAQVKPKRRAAGAKGSL